MKYLKRYLGSILCLVLIDQLVKVIIYFFYFDYERDIIGNIVRFRPIQNTSLSWAGNFINIFSNMSIVVSINILVIALFISGYSFYRSKRNTPSMAANLIYIFGLAASLCSLVDKVFWGGSIDFIQIPVFFTFDLKDCYITVSACLFLVLGLRYQKEISTKDYLKWCFKKK